MDQDFIKMKSSSHSKKKHAGFSQKDKSLVTSHQATTTSNSKQEYSKIDSLIKQFGEMKILLAEAVTKVNRLEKKQKQNTHFTIQLQLLVTPSKYLVKLMA